MVGGILWGRFLPQGNKKLVQNGITVAILLLLFLLGMSVGHNRQIMDNLGTIGLEAGLITLGAVGGSVVCAWLVYRLYFSK